MNDQDIINYFWEGKKILKSQKLKNLPENIKNYLETRYTDSLSILETINRIKIHCEIHPICPICKERLVKYKNKFLSKDIFQKTCDNVICRKKQIGKQCIETCLNKYGTSSVLKLESTKNKSKQTKLERYGNENYHNIEKTKKTNLEKYGYESFYQSEIFKIKSKQTKLEKYGDEKYCNPIKIKQTKLKHYGDENFVNPNKAKQTKLEKYGNENYHNIEKFEKTCLEKYGVKNGGGSNQSLEKTKKTCLKKYNKEYYFQTDEFKEKFKKICLERYGVDHPFKTELIKSKIDYKKLVQKVFETKKKNNSFNKSNPEDNIYNCLITKFKEVKRQYKNKLYPFYCDFYIPEINTYIEYQGFWTHGPHKYDPNNLEDQKILNEWKNKNTGFYKNAIEVWTIADVKKRNIAKKNNLKYLEFFYIKDFYKWFEQF